jgi:hypothetical protein
MCRATVHTAYTVIPILLHITHTAVVSPPLAGTVEGSIQTSQRKVGPSPPQQLNIMAKPYQLYCTSGGDIKSINPWLPALQTSSITSLHILFLYIFWPILCLCRTFCIFERCLDSNPESCRSKQVRYQLSHPSPSLHIHIFLFLSLPG